jgi:hypothetical protein
MVRVLFFCHMDMIRAPRSHDLSITPARKTEQQSKKKGKLLNKNRWQMVLIRILSVAAEPNDSCA